MRIIKIGEDKIKIYCQEEIKQLSRVLYNLIKGKLSGYDATSAEEKYKKALKEPLPFCLFRLNELNNYSLNGVGCEITEAQYMDRIECLPPIPFKEANAAGYIVPECVTGNIYEHILKLNDKYFCVLKSVNSKTMTMLRNWF